MLDELFKLPAAADFEDVADVLESHVDWASVSAVAETRGNVFVTVEVTVAKDYRGDMTRCVVALITQNGHAVVGRVFESY